MRTNHSAKWIAGILAVSWTLALPKAEATIILGQAANYAVLVEPGANSFQLNNSTVNGSVGIGAGLGGGGVQIASNGFINDSVAGQASTGQLQLVDASATVSNTGNVQGGVLFNQSQVTTAINTVNALSTTFKAESGTALSINGGGQVVQATNGILDGTGNYVFTIGSGGFTNNSGGFSINGTANQYVVFNINNGASNVSLGGPISLTGGITSDHVLFNFTGTGSLQSGSTNGASVAGILLATQMKVNLNSVNITGRVFGGAAGQDFQLVSGFNITAPTSVNPVPEPTTALFGIFLTSVVGLSRRRKLAAAV